MAKQGRKEKEIKDDKIEFEGKVLEILPNGEYIVEVQVPEMGAHQVLAYVSGKMRKFYIKLAVGDKVKIEVSLYDPKRGRITYKVDTRPRLTTTANSQNTQHRS